MDIHNVLSASTVVQDDWDKEVQASQLADLAGDRIEKCTFNDGYTNQPVFVCLTCTVKTGEYAGVCLGCSMNCHLEHEILELWNKRSFRCDCGNGKFSSHTCKICPKTGINEKNRYSSNFEGLYCYCRQPYQPDDEMFQCSRCEDWFHTNCISDKDFPDCEAFICSTCIDKCKFLLPYQMSLKAIEDTERTSKKRKLEVDESERETKRRKVSEPEKINENQDNKNENCKRIRSEENVNAKLNFRGAAFAAGWTEKLCRCKDCEKLHESCEIAFLFQHGNVDINLIDIDPSKIPKPEFNRQNIAMRAIDRLPRQRTIDVIDAQQRFHEAIKTNLKELLQSRPVGTIVTEEEMQKVIQQAKEALSAR